MTAPLCGNGRCGQIMAGLATIKAQMPQQAAEHIAAIMTVVLAEYGIDFMDADVRAKVLAATVAVTGVKVDEGVSA